MKATDLRIGNYYQYASDNGVMYTKVQEIKHNQFGLLGDFDGTNFEICKPIPLTEDWLLNYGFEKVIYESDDFGYETNYELDIKGVGYISYSDDFSCALFGSKESS